MTVTVESLLQSSSLLVYQLLLDVFVASKDVQTVSAVVAVVVPLHDLENVFVHPSRRPTAMANNLRLTLLSNLARQRHPAAVVCSLCPNGRSMNGSVTKSKG
jgi:hypothetical protein